jgi:endonuclease-3
LICHAVNAEQKRKKNKMKNISKIIKLLRKEVGRTTAVVWNPNPFFVLISTVLSQRNRDESTEKASKALFKKYNTPKKLANAPIKSIEKLVYSTGFYKTKSRRIKAIAKILVDKYKSKVPKDFNKLIQLPGVGRKTANCVLVYAYQLPAIPVDTHVHRISNRLGLVKTKTPEKSELELTKIIPKKYWIELNELMVKFGQRKCLPIRPKCLICSLNKICNFGKNYIKKGK